MTERVRICDADNVSPRAALHYNRDGRGHAAGGLTVIGWSARGWRSRLIVMMALPMALLGGCGYLPSISLPANPFQSATPTPEQPAVGAQPSPSPVASPVASPPAFAAFWVKNHRITEMWSGPAAGAGVVSFGATTAQFCSFQVVQPPNGPRLYVLNPHSANYLWIDADAVGPVGNAPERRPGPKPANQNCADVVYEG